MNYPQVLKIGQREVKVICEKTNFRTSSVRLRNGKVVLKLSKFVDIEGQERIIKRFLKWAKKKLENSQEIFLTDFKYQDGEEIVAQNKTYVIRVVFEEIKRKRIILQNFSGFSVIKITLPFYSHKQFNLSDIVKKTIMKDQIDYLHDVLCELSIQLFGVQVFRNFRFRDVSSRFGSCTAKGDITIAYCLLFAPKSVFRYVCAHEICHMEEMNHSKKFWGLVEKLAPDYHQAEKWLKTHGMSLM